MPRPSGLPKTGGRKAGQKNLLTADIKALAQKYGPEALAVLAEIAFDKGSPPQARTAASKELLDRGYGKSVAIQQITAEVTTPKTLDAFYGSPDK